MPTSIPRWARLLGASLLLTLAACTNCPTVCVCDPCGCKPVAASILEGRTDIPRPAETMGGAKAPAPADRSLGPVYVLRTKTLRGLDWDGMTLDPALAYLRTVTGVAFTVSPKARAEKLDDIVYDLQLDGVSAATVLQLMTEPFGLRFEARDEVIWILTREELDGPLRLRYFDVKDLVGAEAAFESAEALTEEIRAGVAPAYWGQDEPTIEDRHGILIVRASQAVLERIGAWLSSHRRTLEPVPRWPRGER